MATFKDHLIVNKMFQTYGKAYVVKRELIIAIVIFLCMITPLTNWILLFIHKLVKGDLIWRIN